MIMSLATPENLLIRTVKAVPILQITLQISTRRLLLVYRGRIVKLKLIWDQRFQGCLANLKVGEHSFHQTSWLKWFLCCNIWSCNIWRVHILTRSPLMLILILPFMQVKLAPKILIIVFFLFVICRAVDNFWIIDSGSNCHNFSNILSHKHLSSFNYLPYHLAKWLLGESHFDWNTNLNQG